MGGTTPSGFSNGAGRGAPAGLNHNVLLTTVARATDGIASGIWSYSTLATFLFMIEHNSNAVRH